MKIAVIIPAFNEEKTILDVISQIPKDYSIIIVDDGSTDRTVDFCKTTRAIVRSHEVNNGYDAALITGFRAAQQLEYDYVITMDADGQHDPNELCNFMNEFINGSDLVVGIRHGRIRLSEYLLGILTNYLWKIKDPLCGMKGYNVTTLRRFCADGEPLHYGVDYALKLVAFGIRFSQVPLTVRPRTDSSRFGVGIKINLKIIKSVILSIFRAKFVHSV